MSRAIFGGRSRWRFAAANSAAKAGPLIAAGRSWWSQLSRPEASPTTAFASCCFLPASAFSDPYQMEIAGNQFVGRAAITDVFTPDLGKSILRVPLEARRRQLEAIPWVQEATVERTLPDRIRVEVTERTPVAFLRTGNELQLVDASGVLLERPLEANFHFPVVSGFDDTMPIADRDERMALFVEFMKEIGTGASRRRRTGERSGFLRCAGRSRHAGGPAGARRAISHLGALREWRFREQISVADGKHGAMARQRGARGIGRSAILAAGGGQSRARSAAAPSRWRPPIALRGSGGAGGGRLQWRIMRPTAGAISGEEGALSGRAGYRQHQDVRADRRN